jgi:uncharacterized protein (DUF433 family)
MSSVAANRAENVHITHIAGICGGKACIAGSRIRVQDIYVWHELQGRSPTRLSAVFRS